MVSKKREKVAVEKAEAVTGKRKRKAEKGGIETWIGVANPRTPHPGDIDQPEEHKFKVDELGENPEGENFDSFDVNAEMRRRGSSTCKSVLVMKHKKPLPMWFDEYLCPRVMHGKWCGYVGYAFRRRIKFGSWPRWTNVPKHVKDEAWEDVLSSWDFRTVLTKEEHAKLKKLWTTYASDKMRCWRSCQFKKYVLDVENKVRTAEEVGHPCDMYKWMDPKEWDLFVQYRATEKFRALSEKNSKNSKQKEYIHHTGSGGYRLIYIKKAKEMREAAINKKLDEGMTLEEAEDAVRDMVFKVDRSIVFLEANKKKGSNEYSSKFVEKVAKKILDMNKQKEEGTLIIEGKEDILIKCCGEDPWGRYRACPSTAKMDFALPDYVEQKNQKRRGARRTRIEKARMEAARLAEYNKYGEWIAHKIGVQLSEDISPQQFLKEQLQNNMPSTSATPPTTGQSSAMKDGEGSDEEAPMPCWLQVKNATDEIVIVAAGVVFPEGDAGDGLKAVQIRPPILHPRECLPLPSEDCADVGSALGVPLMWPEDLIDYNMEKQQQESQESSQETESDSWLEDDNCRVVDEDCHVVEKEEPSDIDMSESTLELNASFTQKDIPQSSPAKAISSPREFPDNEVMPPTQDCPVTVQEFHWDFSHHTRDPQVRKEVRNGLTSLQSHPNSRIAYSIPLKDLIFGPKVQYMALKMDQANDWMKSLDRAKKEWIADWQMDLWSSLMHIKMTDEDLERVQLISTVSSFNSYTSAEKGSVHFLKGVLDVLTAKKAKLYVMPFIRGKHWMLFVIVPEERTFYCIDPSCVGVRQDNQAYVYSLLMRLGDKYDEFIGSKEGSTSSPTSWNVINLFHKKQPYTWECGYYTMLNVEKITLLNKGVDVKLVFPEDLTPYPMAVIEGLIDTNCIFLRDAVLPACQFLNDSGKQKRRPKTPALA